MVRHVEQTFLKPLQSALTAWMDDPEVADGEKSAFARVLFVIRLLGSMHAMMPLISLRLGIDRVDGAKAEIFGTGTT